MKKNILLFILFFIGINSINASDSIVIGEWQTEKIIGDNIELVSTERRYKWYKERKVYGNDYYTELDDLSLYSFKDETDYIKTEFSNWDHEYIPKYVEGRTIEERQIRKYHELRPIRYIFFEDIIGGFTTFNISELNILINQKEIEYDIECEKCSPNFAYFINNGINNENNVYIENGGNFKIDLRNYYGIGDIRIELYMYDSVPNTKKCKIYMNEGSTLDDRNYVYKEFVTYVVSDNYLMPERHLIILDGTWIVNRVYMDWIYLDNDMALNTTFYREMVVGVERRYKDIKYRYYNIEKDYLDGYYVSVEDNEYKKDETQYLDFYKYKIVNNQKKEFKLVNNITKEVNETVENNDLINENINFNNKLLNDLSNKIMNLEEVMFYLIIVNTIFWILILLLLIINIIKVKKLSYQKKY